MPFSYPFRQDVHDVKWTVNACFHVQFDRENQAFFVHTIYGHERPASNPPPYLPLFRVWTKPGPRPMGHPIGHPMGYPQKNKK